jgi:predicted O-linked N-acetylglucosamine transferase (SPINDLY family)
MSRKPPQSIQNKKLNQSPFKNSQEILKLLQHGLDLHNSGKINDAKLIYEQILKKQSNHFDALQLLATACGQQGNPDLALKYFDQAIKINNKNSAIFNNKGIVLKELKRFEEAIQNYDAALHVDPKYAAAYNNKGNALQALKRFEEALQSYEAALDIKPDYIEALNNKGNALKELKRFDLALQSYEAALLVNPQFAEVHNNKGNVLKDLKRFNEALQSYEVALRIKPNYAEAFYNVGIVLQALKLFNEALQSYNAALSVNPNYAQAHNNKGIALQELKRFDEALQSYDAALLIYPEFADVHNNKGSALEDLKRFDEALLSYEKALLIKPDYTFLFSKAQHMRMSLCDWKNFNDTLENLKNSLLEKKLVSHPFEIQALLDSPDLQKKSADLFVNEKYPIQLKHTIFNQQRTHQKIKIGYFSSDFGNHPVSHLLAGVLEEHDRNNFEILAFSLVNNKHDLWRDRIMKGVDQFIDVSNKSDQEVAALAQSLELDIAIDLNGHTKNSRPGIFSHRVAPIQASYIGFLGTMGATYFDYLIADRVLIPEESQEFYSEKIVYLPSYQCNDSKFSVSDQSFKRNEFGLPDDAFVFCSFNSNWKITPLVFDAWMRILNQVNHSVLWIYVENEISKENLRKEAQIRGVDPGRLIFAERILLKEHLARQRLADLFLDTFPYNAGATASSALRVELPLITRSGKSFASRYGASLLTALGIPELITNSTEEFEYRAIELAMNPELLHSIKEKLAHNLVKYPLFDTIKFTRSIESAFHEMHERSQNQLQPDHIYISD